MADLMLHLKVHLRNLFKEPLKMHKKVTERTHLMLPLMVYLKVHLSVQLSTPLRVHLKAHLKMYSRDLYKTVQEGIFEVENKDALELTIELHLKIDLVVLLLVYKSAQNDSTKGFHFKEHCKIQKNIKKEM